MALVYITGVAGSGKSTARKELLNRGYKAYGGSEDKLGAFYNNQSGKRINRKVPIDERTQKWLSEHTWRIPVDTIKKLRQESKDQLVFVCSGTLNMDGLWGLFDRIIALKIDDDTVRHRVATRKGANWGKSPTDLSFIFKEQKEAEKEYQKFNVVVIDSTQPPQAVVDKILKGAGVELARAN